MGAFVAIFQIPIIVLNIFGFIGSAIWLLVIGQWIPLVVGIVISIFAPFALGLAVLPSMIFAMPGIRSAERGFTIGVYFFTFLSSVYVALLITGWCGAITYYFLKDAPSYAFWPLLIWSYGVATSPWTYMAQKDEGVASTMAAFFAQAAYVVMMIAIAFGADLKTAAQVFSLVMVIEVICHMRLLAEMKRAGMMQTLI
jgi:hypothetical protein